MKSFHIIIGLMVIGIFLSLQSCEPKVGKNDKVRSIGNTSEVLVIMQNNQQKDGKMGLVIEEHLGKEQYGLLQAEPLFDIAYITVKNFSNMFKKHRNLFIINIEKESIGTNVESYTDRWSKPQRVVVITTPSTADFVNDFPQYAESIIDNFSVAERQRILSVFRPSSKNKVLKSVRDNFKFNITIPQGFYVAKTEKDFMWIRKEVTEYSQGIIIFAEPYLDKKQFSKESIVARTNRYLKQYVPGDSPGTYMSLTDEYLVPTWKQVEGMDPEYAIEMRGVWDVKSDFMGGPYVSYTFVDPLNDNITTIMGYVYHPNKKKRNLLRQLEAIIYSVKLKNPQ